MSDGVWAQHTTEHDEDRIVYVEGGGEAATGRLRHDYDDGCRGRRRAFKRPD